MFGENSFQAYYEVRARTDKLETHFGDGLPEIVCGDRFAGGQKSCTETASFQSGNQGCAMCNKLVGRTMEILLVEDSLLQARMAIKALETGHVKHRMTLVMDGEEALDFLHRRGVFAKAPRPDLILLDLRLPKIDGLEVLSEIKVDYDLKSIPLVVMTSSEDDEDKQRCEMLNVECYIKKPVELEKFLAVVKQLKSHWQADVILPALT